MIPFGFLPIVKPVGPTSHDMVARLRRQLPKGVKVGHTGTLDPFASGVMLLAVGKATRFADDVHLLSKTYRARIRLGVRTDTLDATGTVDLEMAVPPFTQTQLDALALDFIGSQEQLPPSYSAKKVDGKKSYELARKNVEVILKPSTIQIFALTLLKQDDLTLICDVHCGTGTYVRSLGRDIGERLGTCAHLLTLERSSVGPITLAETLSLDPVPSDWLSQLWPVSKLLPQFPEVELDDPAFAYLVQGRALPCETAQPAEFLGICRHDGQVQAIFRCTYDAENQTIQTKHLCYLVELGSQA